jgi:hypothetical protein
VTAPVPQDVGAQLRRLYARVDAEAARLQERHAERLQCRRGCSMCCVDEISVTPVEAHNIRARHADLLRGGTPHPPGMCAFLDEEGACRIYVDRPYVCRSQGLPLRWTDTDDDGRLVEYRDICSLNAEGESLEELPADACWSIGWAEGALAHLQSQADGVDPLSFDDDDDDDEESREPAMERVALRDLFERPAAESL